MSSDTDAVYVRALDESEAEGTQTMIIRLHDEDSVSVSTGNLLDDVSITDPPGNQFEINTTSIQALSVGTAAEAIVTAKVRSDGDFQATAFSSSTPAAAVRIAFTQREFLGNCCITRFGFWGQLSNSSINTNQSIRCFWIWYSLSWACGELYSLNYK